MLTFDWFSSLRQMKPARSQPAHHSDTGMGAIEDLDMKDPAPKRRRRPLRLHPTCTGFSVNKKTANLQYVASNSKADDNGQHRGRDGGNGNEMDCD